MSKGVKLKGKEVFQMDCDCGERLEFTAGTSHQCHKCNKQFSIVLRGSELHDPKSPEKEHSSSV